MELCDIGIINERCRNYIIRFPTHEIGSAIAIWGLMVDVPTINNLFSSATTVLTCPLCSSDEVPRRMPKEHFTLASIHRCAFNLNRRLTRFL